MWYFQSSFESSLLRFFCSMTLIPMTATLVFQHNAEAFLNTRVISGLEKNVIKYCHFLLTSDEIRTGTAKPSLLLPTNQYLLQHRRSDRGWKTRKPPFPMTIFLPQPCSSRCCWWRVNSSVLPEELQNWTFYLLLSSPEHFICYSPLPWSLCSSPIPSMDLQTPPLQPPSRGSVFIIVFIIAPHSYTAGSLHLKEIKNQKNAVRGWTMIPELQKWRNFWEGEGTHLVFLGIWWFKHIIVNCLEIVAAKSSECLQSLPAPFVWVLIEN